MAFWLSTAQQKKYGWWTTPPSGGIGAEEVPSPEGFPWNLQLPGRKKWLPWLWLSRAVQSDQECLQEYYVEQCSTSLAPILKGDGLLNLEMLDVAKKDPMTPASASPTPEPK